MISTFFGQKKVFTNLVLIMFQLTIDLSTTPICNLAALRFRFITRLSNLKINKLTCARIQITKREGLFGMALIL